MTTFPAELTFDGYYEFVNIETLAAANPSESAINDLIWGGGESAQIEYYMRGKDADCGILTYRYWTSINFADISAIGYSGPKCGANPLEDITILSVKIKQT